MAVPVPVVRVTVALDSDDGRVICVLTPTADFGPELLTVNVQDDATPPAAGEAGVARVATETSAPSATVVVRGAAVTDSGHSGAR